MMLPLMFKIAGICIKLGYVNEILKGLVSPAHDLWISVGRFPPKYKIHSTLFSVAFLVTFASPFNHQKLINLKIIQ